jgi:mRNA interferase RelE/StbE
MAVKFRREAIKFLQKIPPDDVIRIQLQLNRLLTSMEEQGIIPFTELDIKKMRGDWEGFYRIRIGKIRVIFSLTANSKDIEVYTIGFRGDVYK